MAKKHIAAAAAAGIAAAAAHDAPAAEPAEVHPRIELIVKNGQLEPIRLYSISRDEAALRIAQAGVLMTADLIAAGRAGAEGAE